MSRKNQAFFIPYKVLIYSAGEHPNAGKKYSDGLILTFG